MTDSGRISSSAPRRSRRGRYALAAIAVAAALGVAAYAAWNRPGAKHERSSAGVTATRGPAPSSVSIPGGLGQRGLAPSGIDPDGWVTDDVGVRLAGGAAAVLAVHGQVPITDQQVTVLVGGRQASAQALPAGPISLHVLLPASRGPRDVELRFARTVKLKAPDTRVRAAQITSIGIRPVKAAPTQVVLPDDLSKPNVIADGVASDGWVGKNASVALSGGAAAALVVRAQVPPLPNGASQRLTVAVNRSTIVNQTVQPGSLTLRLPIGPSRGVRSVGLAWSGAAPLSKADPRHLSARLLSVGLTRLEGARTLKLPAALSRPGVVYSGIYADGWAQRDVSVVLAGGPTAVLRVTLLTQHPRQQVSVLVDGDPLVTTAVAPGEDTVEAPLVANTAPRLIELRFAHAQPIAANDKRPAAALLRTIGLRALTSAAPGSIDLPAGLASRDLAYSGIYRDGWAERDVRVVIAGGKATSLAVAAQTAAKAQRMTVLVDGRRLGSARLRRGRDLVRVGLRASTGPRLVELRFARVARIAANDKRLASTLLQRISLAGAARSRPASAPTLGASLTPGAVVPPLTGNANGTFVATLPGTTLRWTLQLHGLSGPIVAAVIHTGGAGVIGPRLVDLCAPCTETESGTAQLSSAEATAVRTGSVYVNVGTTAHPYGEIRGAITRR